jgi:hypothetical protein
MQLNGVVLISTVLNWQDQEFHIGNDLPYPIILPTYTAAAWSEQRKFKSEIARFMRAAVAGGAGGQAAGGR